MSKDSSTNISCCVSNVFAYSTLSLRIDIIWKRQELLLFSFPFYSWSDWALSCIINTIFCQKFPTHFNISGKYYLGKSWVTLFNTIFHSRSSQIEALMKETKEQQIIIREQQIIWFNLVITAIQILWLPKCTVKSTFMNRVWTISIYWACL